jgi:hypothetical protein
MIIMANVIKNLIVKSFPKCNNNPPTTIFQKTNLTTCKNLVIFQAYLNLASLLFKSASSPLVPHEISSILHIAYVFNKIR